MQCYVFQSKGRKLGKSTIPGHASQYIEDVLESVVNCISYAKDTLKDELFK